MTTLAYLLIIVLVLLPFLLEGAYNFHHEECEKSLKDLKDKKNK